MDYNSVQQISYKSEQSIINNKKKMYSNNNNKSSNIQNKIRVRPQGVRKNMGQGIEGMPKIHRRQPYETVGRTADQPDPLSPQYRTEKSYWWNYLNHSFHQIHFQKNLIIQFIFRNILLVELLEPQFSSNSFSEPSFARLVIVY